MGCNKCEHFRGYDENGCPDCSLEGGADFCPFYDEFPAKEKENETKIVLDMEYFYEYIKNTMENTFRREAVSLAKKAIADIAKEEYEEKVRSIQEEEIRKRVFDQVSKFMDGDITVGGGWCEPTRKISRIDYLNELIQKVLDERFSESGIKKLATDLTQREIDKFMRETRDKINYSIKTNFDEATKNTLTSSVVNLLMANDTYRKLSDNMERMLGS